MANYTKIIITGEIEIVTGLHIGGGSDFSAIGAIDSPVVRDSLTKLPIIPGSSLKGKLRKLLATSLKGVLPAKPNLDPAEVLRLFGSSEKGDIQKSRLKFNDCFFKDETIKKLQGRGLSLTEVKSENTINRQTAVANPRQIERVIRGSVFDFELFYDMEDENQVIEDIKNIKKAFDLLEYDYLGGHGTRGSGRVKFNQLTAKNAIGECAQIEEIQRILGE